MIQGKDEGIDEVELEKRLTHMESNISNGFTGIHNRLDKLNGQVGKHDDWIMEQKLTAREIKGFVEGRSAMRKKDLAIVSGIVTLLAGVLQGGFVILGKVS